MTSVETFETLRPYLMSVAYRLLGSVMEAEDILQEAFLRWQKVDWPVDSARRYLTTVVTRLCIDHLRTARVQREQYIGPWLPEPLLTDGRPRPEGQAALADSLSLAFLIMLESLESIERAVFVLREVFAYSYPEIGILVGKSQANCRKIASRARQKVAARRPQFEHKPARQAAVEQFVTSLQKGDIAGLVDQLAEDVVWYSDGGGLPGVARKPIQGAEAVTRFIGNLARQAPADAVLKTLTVNDSPGLVLYSGGRPLTLLVFEMAAGKIQTIYAIVNPVKLRHLPPLEVS